MWPPVALPTSAQAEDRRGVVLVTREPADHEPRRGVPEEHDQGITVALLDAHRPIFDGVGYRCSCGLPEPCYGSPDDRPLWA